MPVDRKNKILFVHIPKNAGVSICKAFNLDLKGVHKPVWEYEKEFNDYYKIAVCRDPYYRFISAYRFAKQYDLKNPDKAKYKTFYDRGMSGCIEAVKNGCGGKLFKPQNEFIYKNGEVKVDHVFYLEEINLWWDWMCGLFKKNVPIRKENTTLPIKDLFIGEIIDFVNHYYKEDFKLFKYIKA